MPLYRLISSQEIVVLHPSHPGDEASRNGLRVALTKGESQQVGDEGLVIALGLLSIDIVGDDVGILWFGIRSRSDENRCLRVTVNWNLVYDDLWHFAFMNLNGGIELDDLLSLDLCSVHQLCSFEVLNVVIALWPLDVERRRSGLDLWHFAFVYLNCGIELDDLLSLDLCSVH